MTTLLVPALLALGAGTALLLERTPWFGRRSLTDRLRPYAPPSAAGPATGRADTTVGAVLGPVLELIAGRLARAGDRGRDLQRRLDRAGSADSPAGFRLRQLRHAAMATAAGGAAAFLTGSAGITALVLVAAPPAGWVLADEQRLRTAAESRGRRIQLELPVVAEQLGILVGAGYSLPAAVARIGRRGRGVVAADLAEVGRRVRHGLSDAEALSEWERRVDLPAVRRLVGILSMHRDAGDLGRLVSEEAKAIRAETHRDLIESIERRSQLVWIPVTLATLVPGLLFLAVPFVAAISQVTGS